MVPKGRELASTDFGRMWMEHSESYFTRGLRSSKGRMLLRSGAVSISIVKGQRIDAIVRDVDGDHSVSIVFDRLNDDEMAGISERFGNELILGVGREKDSLTGLFPGADKVHATCDCGDGGFCHHSAAVVFSIGTLLDSDPELLLRLRGIGTETIMKDVLQDRLSRMLANARKRTERVLPDDVAERIFKL